MKVVKIAAAAALLMSASASVSFAAQAETPCSCITAGPSAGPVGSIIAAKGEVLASGAKTYEAVKPGTPISVGSEISVGAKSSAQISVGTCALPLMSNSVTQITAQKDGNLCVASVQTTTASYGADIIEEPIAAAPVAAATPSWIPLGIFAGTVAGATLLILTNDSNKPISQ